jgi:glycosyltransferase involved in cell wall biosynthesis
MKILFHHRIASTDGQFVHLSELTAALRKLGHDVRVVGPKIGTSGALGETNKLISRLKKAVPSALYEVLEFAYSAIATARLFKAAYKFSPDCIYERYNLHLHAGRFVAKRLKVPFLLEVNAPLTEERKVYGNLTLEKFATWSDRIIWNSADVTLPVTNVLADYLRNAGVPEKKIHVIHNGADLSQYEKQTRGDCRNRVLQGDTDSVVFGFVGFIRSWHGLSKVVDFIESKPDLRIKAIFVGDGNEEKIALENQILKAGLSEKVHITGFVPRHEIPSYIGAFDVALQPASTLYSSPLKLFEYMAAGCAILAPATANIKEVLSHGSTGLLFDPENTSDMIRCFERLCTDEELRIMMGRRTKELCENFPYTWLNNAATVVSIIELIKQQPYSFEITEI